MTLQLRKRLVQQLLDVVDEPAIEDLVVEQIRSLPVFHLDSFGFFAGDVQKMFVTGFDVSRAFVENFADNSSVCGSLVGNQVDSEEVEFFVVSAVF